MADREWESGPSRPGFEADYAKEVTEESYREIERLALWARGKGPVFYLIGGWAAWRFHRGLGSRDIDVIFPTQSILDAFLHEYYLNNGFERTGGILTSFYHKRVQTPTGTKYIEIDAAQLDRGLPFHEDEQLDLPYRLLERYHSTWQVGSQEVLMPIAELLILQKVKAHRDRSWDLEHAAVDVGRIAFLRSKVAKDAYDIRGLAPHVRDWGLVRAIANDNASRKLVAETLDTLDVRAGL